ncbi:hypothetical protein [Carboxylicivirga sediminis]|uniref:hypothetical protein n=1 Tax=Carboxylicivirga sediminis TaxID=2006564 RepID=UPI001FD1A896|nr:hypothetical protein [Carboxylicivirga sediminis]
MIKRYLTLVTALILVQYLTAQSVSHYEDPYYSPFERYIYQPGTNFHTSIRQYRMDQLNEVINTDSVLYDNLRIPEGRLNIWQRFLHDDLISLDKEDINIVVNPLFAFEGGRENSEGITTWTNTRGLFIKGNIGKLYFYTDFVENQAVVPNYINVFANKTNMMPGQGQRKNFGTNGHDYAQATGYIGFNFAKYFNFQLGNGKHFIGDGHRSLLLSDGAFSYPYVKLTADFWNIKYMVMWNKMLNYDSVADQHDFRYPGKYGVHQYLDWNINKRLSLGFYANVVYAEKDTTGHRGFDIHYLNPVNFFRPVEYNLGSPDNVTMGFNARYIASKWLTFYGQFVMGEFKFDEVFSGNKWWANKHGFQLGAKTFDLFGINKLDVQLEYNQARPYTYSHYTSIYSYSHLNQPMAHILGANFREGLAILKYRKNRWQFKAELMATMYGDDYGDGISWGKDVLMPNTQRPLDTDGRPREHGYSIGDGLKTNVYNADVNVSFLVNPRNMFNIVAGARIRKMSNDLETIDTQHVYFGIRTSLKSLYYNF